MNSAIQKKNFINLNSKISIVLCKPHRLCDAVSNRKLQNGLHLLEGLEVLFYLRKVGEIWSDLEVLWTEIWSNFAKWIGRSLMNSFAVDTTRKRFENMANSMKVDGIHSVTWRMHRPPTWHCQAIEICMPIHKPKLSSRFRLNKWNSHQKVYL